MIENLSNKARSENLLVSIKGGHVSRAMATINQGLLVIVGSIVMHYKKSSNRFYIITIHKACFAIAIMMLQE